MINAVLFLVTLGTTLLAGTLQRGGNPFQDFSQIRLGVPFAFTLLGILGVHELGHYFMARRHRTNVSLPYFIPAPTLLGTFGAVIRMRSPLPDRKALLDVGAAGPLVGFCFALLATIVGLDLSEVIRTPPQGALVLGNSLLFALTARIVKGPLTEGYDILLHPVAFAGWIGLLVTSINLFPAGQLDGGHITYSLFGRRHSLIAKGAFGAMFCLGFLWPGWFFWAGLILILGLKHPPPLEDIHEVDMKRKVVGLIAFLILILTFVPVPFGYLK